MFDQKQKLIAVAIAGTFALPLTAEAQSNVQIYGRLYPEVASLSFSGATATGARMATMSPAAAGTPGATTVLMDSPNSRAGFRGSEDLGGGMKAIYQLEMGFGVDTGNNSSGTAGALFSRNTFVGMKGGFGTVKLGSMDTVYKELGDTMSYLGISSGNFMSTSNILSKPGFGTSSASSFHLRRGNSLYYESPEFGGLQALYDYSFGESPGSTSSLRVISAGLKYEAGPLYLAVAHEIHDNLFGASKNIPAALANPTTGAVVTSVDTGTRWTAQYRFNSDSRIEGNYVTIKYDESGGAATRFANYKHNAWSLGGEHKIGAVTLVASYGAAGAGSCSRVGGIACDTTGLDGKMYDLGAGYSFSKRTLVFAFYTKLVNGSSATYTNVVSDARPTPGQDIGTFALGIKHDF